MFRILITSLLTFTLSCAGYQGHNIKLKDYPKVNKEEIAKLNLFYGKKSSKNSSMYSKFKEYGVRQDKSEEAEGCELLGYTNVGVYNPFFCFPITNIAAMLTLTIIPYYCQQQHESTMNLISITKNPTTNKLEEKTLKTYHLKERSHEVWSLLWLLNPYSWDDVGPITAQAKVNQRLSEAMVRKVLNDVKNYEECKKKN